MFSIGDVQIEAPVFLAPMAGVSDAPFRSEVVSFGAPAAVSEMVAGATLAEDSPESLRRCLAHDGASPFIVQLAARRPEDLAEGARRAVGMGADIIDINMGCPAKRVTGGLSGCALMREPLLVAAMVRAAVAASDRPVTVKMRLGWDDASRNAPEIARIAEAEGARMVTVHGRTRQQFYTGSADWEPVAAVVDSVDLPVIVNGDIACATSARAALSASGAAGVMIGRAAVGRPWLVGEIASELAGRPFQSLSLETRLASMRRQLLASVRLHGDHMGVRTARKHLAAFIDAVAADLGVPWTRDDRARLCRLETVEAVLESLAAPADLAEAA